MTETSPLTERQRETLDYYRRFTERRGKAPTMSEVGRALGVTRQTVHSSLAHLQAAGVVVRQRGQHRGVRVLDMPS